jgi:UDP-3-O-acyl N-acetylglucosamine deacetylase
VTVRRQRTIARPCRLAGRGLHSGGSAQVRCLPAPADTGIVFVPAEVRSEEIPARLDAVVSTRRGVTLGRGRRVVRTVEHLLAAAYALGIMNLRVELDGDELPALDGSALPYLRALQDAGSSTQDAEWTPVVLGQPVWVTQGAASILAVPAPSLRISYVVRTGVMALGTQSVDFSDPAAAFAEQIASSRTWGFAHELDTLRAEGLALGASEENTLGLGPEGYQWPSRFPDEPARHKVLDLLGDVALLGRPLCAHIMAVAAGHTLHVELARRIHQREQGSKETGGIPTSGGVA